MTWQLLVPYPVPSAIALPAVARKAPVTKVVAINLLKFILILGLYQRKSGLSSVIGCKGKGTGHSEKDSVHPVVIIMIHLL